MKILAPIKNLLSWIEVIKSWVWEIYFWVVSDSWEEKHWFKSILNRRDWSLANISNFSDWEKLIEYAKKQNVEAYITLNNSPIINDEKLIIEEIKSCIKIKPDALIIKDIYIAKLVRDIDKKIPIHCSSLNQVINSESIKYWIENFNISRMIFPRNIAISEIKNLCSKFPKLEFEIFVKNDWCYNSDWVCSSLHFEWLKDWLPFVCHRENLYKVEDKILEENYKELLQTRWDCKVCMLYQLQNIPNLVSLKIVGREKPLEVILRDINFIKTSLNFLKLSDNNEEFMDFTINNYTKNIKKSCQHKRCEIYNTYYKK